MNPEPGGCRRSRDLWLLVCSLQIFCTRYPDLPRISLSHLLILLNIHSFNPNPDPSGICPSQSRVLLNFRSFNPNSDPSGISFSQSFTLLNLCSFNQNSYPSGISPLRSLVLLNFCQPKVGSFWDLSLWITQFPKFLCSRAGPCPSNTGDFHRPTAKGGI